MPTIESLRPQDRNQFLENRALSPAEINRILNDGLLIVVTTIPTGENRHQRIGGVGSSTLAKALAYTLGGTLLQTGEIMREFAARVGCRSEAQFHEFRNYMEQHPETAQKLDRKVDNRNLKKALKLLKQGETVIIDSKLAALLYPPISETLSAEEEQSIPPAIFIGITADDHTATERMLQRKLSKGESGEHITFAGVERERRRRFRTDRRIYRNSYPHLAFLYDEDLLAGVCHYLFINNQSDDPNLHYSANRILTYIGHRNPQIAHRLQPKSVNNT